MKKKFIILPIILLVLVFVFSLPCNKYLTCEGKAMDILQYPGLWFLILIPLSLFAIILSDQKHRLWLKFTGMFFIVAMFFVFSMPEMSGSFIPDLDRETTNWFFIGLYSFISIIYFIFQFFRKNEKEKVTKDSPGYFV